MWKLMSKVETSQANLCAEGEIAIGEGWGGGSATTHFQHAIGFSVFSIEFVITIFVSGRGHGTGP